MGVEYNGRVNVTRYGKVCQTWTSETPHHHTMWKRHQNFPEKNSSLARNYCRNPDLNGWKGPWCYTIDPDKRWDYCNVRCCPEYHC